MPRSSPFADKGALEGAARAAADKLLGISLGLPELQEESPLERAGYLVRQLGAIAEPKVNPYQASFIRFLTELVWTKDEAAGGRVARMPDWPMLHDMADDLITKDRVMFEKSRRVLATWTACALDVWLAAGGQDPRWVGQCTAEHPRGEPVLMYSQRNRQIFLIHRKFEDANKYLKERVWFIIDQLIHRDIWRDWPEFPQWHWKEGEISNSNGSLITAVAQGSDQTRGFAATALHLEELAFWENAQQTVEQALHTLRGGGHVYAITTPRSATYAKRIRDGKIMSGMW